MIGGDEQLDFNCPLLSDGDVSVASENSTEGVESDRKQN